MENLYQELQGRDLARQQIELAELWAKRDDAIRKVEFWDTLIASNLATAKRIQECER